MDDFPLEARRICFALELLEKVGARRLDLNGDMTCSAGNSWVWGIESELARVALPEGWSWRSRQFVPTADGDFLLIDLERAEERFTASRHILEFNTNVIDDTAPPERRKLQMGIVLAVGAVQIVHEMQRALANRSFCVVDPGVTMELPPKANILTAFGRPGSPVAPVEKIPPSFFDGAEIDFIRCTAWRDGLNFYDIRALVTNAAAEDAPVRTGLQGRPTGKHLILHEFRRRASEGTLLPSLATEALHLAEWYRDHHPTSPGCTAKTIENVIRLDYKANTTKSPTK